MSLKIFELMATVGLDDSAYRQSINEAKAQTKTAVAAMTKDYNRLYSEVLHLTAAYQKSSKETGENSKATKELKEKLKETQAQLTATANGLKTAEQYMESFASSTSKASGESLTGALTKANLLTGALTKLGSVALSAAKSFVQSGVSYNAQIESYTVGFTNMLGSAEAAQQVMAAIQEDAAKTPFDVASLTQANQLLISAGENAGYSEKVIMALGDAVSATGGGNAELSRMAANLQQIANVGKASAIDIKQFAYAGINIYQILADYTGKTVQEVQNMTISYDTLSQALIAASEEGGRYYGAMETQSQTMNGRISTLKDNVSQLAGLMTGDLSSGIGIVISNLNDMVVAAQDAYKTDGWAGLGEAILDLDNPISTIIKKFRDLGSEGVGVLDRLSFKLNKALGKEAYSQYDSYEDYATDKQKQQNRDRLRQRALSGKSVSNKSWSERQAEAAAAASGSSITTNPSGKTTTPKAVAADTKKLADTIKETSTEIVAGTGNIVGSIQRVTETAANTYDVYDGTTKEIKGTTKETVKTITDSWVEVVDGTEKTIKRVTKEVTDADGKITKTVNQTCDNVVLSVTEMQNRIDKNLSSAQQKWSGGVFGTIQSLLTNAQNGNWSGIASNIASLIWGEVSQEQRNIISQWVDDALEVINEKYSSGGLSAVKDTLHQLFTDGIAQDANEAGKAVQGFGEILSGLGASGGMGTKLAGIVTNFSGMAEGITGALGSIVSFIIANPVVAAILGLTALVGGVALSSMSKNKDSVTNNYESPFSKTPVYDSLSEFSYRAEQLNRYNGITASPFTNSQQDSTGKQQVGILQRISDSLDEHLPAIGTGQLVIDANGVQAIAGAMQPAMTDSMDGDLGIRAARKARGN